MNNNNLNDNNNEEAMIVGARARRQALLVGPLAERRPGGAPLRKQQMGSALRGSLQIVVILTEGPFGYCR